MDEEKKGGENQRCFTTAYKDEKESELINHFVLKSLLYVALISYL